MTDFLDRAIEAQLHGDVEVARSAATSMAAFILSYQTGLRQSYREQENGKLFDCALRRQRNFESAQRIKITETESQRALLYGASAIAHTVVLKELGDEVLLEIPPRFLDLDQDVTTAIQQYYLPLESLTHR